MNVCVYGAGAVGGSIAARLAAAGENVSVIARGAHAEAIRQGGLTVLSGDSRIKARVRVANDPSELGAQEVVIVAVKGHQLPAIAKPLGRMLESGAHAVFALNGVQWWFANGLPLRLPGAFADALDPNGELRRRIPPERVVGAVVNSSNEVIEPGVILNTTPQRNRLVVGAANGASTVAVAAISEMLAHAGYDAPVTLNIRQHLWNKLALYIGVAPMAALTHCAVGTLLADPDARAMMAALMGETIAIGERLGFSYPGDANTDLDFFRGRTTRPSMLQDFELGRRPELTGTILAVEAFAQALDVDASRIAAFATMLRLKASGSGR